MGFLNGVKKFAKDASSSIIQYDSATGSITIGSPPVPSSIPRASFSQPSTPTPQSPPNPFKDNGIPVPIPNYTSLFTDDELERMIKAEEMVQRRPREEKLSKEEWQGAFDSLGFINFDAFREKIYLGGVDEEIRPEVWKYLLKYFPGKCNKAEREEIRKKKKREYSLYKTQWESITEEQELYFSKYRATKDLIEKDVIRTDRNLPLYESDLSPNLRSLYSVLLSYSFFNFDIGYVQGMNDLVSLLFYIQMDEEDTFWCFKGLMDRIMYNFDKNQIGIHTQLSQLVDIIKYVDPPLYVHLQHIGGANMFFCYRWLLILFKREFQYEVLPFVWEVILADHFTTHHHLFVCAAMLLSTRSTILTMQFDEILRHLNEATKYMNYETILIEADYLYRKFFIICDQQTQKAIFSKRVQPENARKKRL